MSPWKPGQSGNPGGSSKKQRSRKMLREAIRRALDEDVPDELLVRLREVLGPDLIGGAVADVVAARLVTLALDGNKSVALNAIAQMVAVEPKQHEHSFGEDVQVTIDATPKRLDDVKDVLRESEALH